MMSTEARVSQEQIEKEVEEMKLKELTIESLEAVSAELVGVADTIVDQIPNIEFDNPTQAAQDLMLLVSPISEFFQFWKSVEILFELDFAQISLGADYTVADHNEKLAELLDNLLAAFENNDQVSVTDILEYEIAPALKDYTKVIPGLIETVKSKKVA